MILQSLVLGVVQGITEFLPISSSAHLVILPYLFHWQWQGLVFDVALHFGTLLAILIFFWRDITAIIRSAFQFNRNVIASDPKERGNLSENKIASSKTPRNDTISNLTTQQFSYNFLWMLVLATVPGVIAGVLLEEVASTIFRSPLLIAINLIVFGIIIWLVDKRPSLNYSSSESSSREVLDSSRQARTIPSLTLKKIGFAQAFLIGLAQMLAIVPGVSRSGATMAAGRLLGLNRPDCARFSFLLAVPIMFGSAAYEARHFSLSMVNAQFIISFVASFIFGLLAIKYLLKYLQRGSFGVFAVYRVILAVIVIAVYFLS